MKDMRRHQVIIPALVLAMLVIVGAATAARAHAGTSPYIVRLAGYQSQPAVTASDTVFQSSPTSDGETDLLGVKLTGALPAATVAAGAGYQQSPAGDRNLVAYVDKTNPSSGDPSEIVYSLRVVDLQSGESGAIASGSTTIEQPSLSGGHLVWTQGAAGSKDVHHCQLDLAGDGVADFLQVPGWTASPEVLCTGAADQYAASAGVRGVVWTDKAVGADQARVLFREWGAGAPDQLLSAGTGFKQPSPALGGALVVWKQKADDTAASHIAVYDLDSQSTEYVGSVTDAMNSGAVTDGTRVAWQSQVGTGKPQVWVRDEGGAAAPAAPFGSSQTSPRLSTDGVLWIDDRYDGGDVAILSESSLDEATLVLAKSSIVGAYNTAVTVQGTLKSSASPLEGRTVRLKKGSAVVRTTTTGTGSAAGAFTFSFVPTNVTTYYTVEFSGDTEYRAAASSVKITPKALLSTPRVPSQIKRYRSFKAYTYIAPKHASGSTGATFFFYRYQRMSNGKYGYVLRKTISAKATNSSAYPTKSRATVSAKLTNGKWRVRAKHADTGHYATYSSYKYFKVYR